jgi:hypothetical protein
MMPRKLREMHEAKSSMFSLRSVPREKLDRGHEGCT